MLACVDVHYRDASATAACVAFERWTDASPAGECIAHIADPAPYEPGRFYLRELPCILAVLRKARLVPSTLVVDGYVWLGEGVAGLGSHVYEALGRRTAVIGFAKTSFAGATVARPLRRGASRRPLFVTAVGVAIDDAVEHIRTMHGEHRIPTLLARVDRLARVG